jgi:hypothetical protein
MKKVIDYLKYEGGNIRPFVLYTKGVPFEFEGEVKFRLFGEAKMNGAKISNTEMKVICGDTKIVLEKDSTIVFWKAPTYPKEIPECIPVEPVPDYMDDQTRQMHAMFENWAQERGLMPKEMSDSEAQPSNVVNLYEDMEEEDDFEFPIDTFSLVEDNEILENVGKQESSSRAVQGEEVSNVEREEEGEVVQSQGTQDENGEVPGQDEDEASLTE